ncbi:MAG TPA: sulfur carrier protein ThiS [Bryobacteraceae bacterium]|nr:sulfur carrier protein ThiS [Bryobacteraceae bacterium]
MPGDATTLTILVNGEPREIREGQTIADLLCALHLDPERLAVELDRRIVKRPAWPSTVLHAGSNIEIVQFVGGG